MKIVKEQLSATYIQNKVGISLISLIITIIVIIILAAIVIFTGLNTPDSANFAKFCQTVDNVQMAVTNRYADLKAKHAIAKESRTDEQIYLEIATGTDNGMYNFMCTTGNSYKKTSQESTGEQNIIPANAKISIGMELPKIREYNEAWYVTKEGNVFNANGYTYNDKTYFDGKTHYDGELGSNNTDNHENALAIYNSAISKGINVVTLNGGGNQQLSSDTIQIKAEKMENPYPLFGEKPTIKVTQINNNQVPTEGELSSKSQSDLQQMFVFACQSLGAPFSTWNDVSNGDNELTVEDAFNDFNMAAKGYTNVYDLIIQTGAYNDVLQFICNNETVTGVSARFTLTDEGDYEIIAKDENNNVVATTTYSYIAEKITFTIDGKEYTAIAGSTWKEWADSKYNTDNFEYSTQNYIIQIDSSRWVDWNMLRLDGKYLYESGVTPDKSKGTGYIGTGMINNPDLIIIDSKDYLTESSN